MAQGEGSPEKRIWRHSLVTNAIVAGVYAAIALALPATAFANYRLATALIHGLALGNALSGSPQGPIDIIFGGIIGLLTAWACSRLHPSWAPLAVLILPTVLVPVWLSVIFGVPYKTVVPVVGLGQLISALLAWIVVLPVGRRLLGRTPLPRDQGRTDQVG